VLRISKRPEPVNIVHCPSCNWHEPFCYSHRHRPTPKNTLRGNPGCAVGPKTPTAGSKEQMHVPWGGPEPVWPVSLVPYLKSCTLHRSVTGALVFGTISPVHPTTWGLELGKRCLSPGVVRSSVVAQPGPMSWACTLHHPATGVLVPRTTIHGVRTHNLVS
jgi:hypothetical protein